MSAKRNALMRDLLDDLPEILTVLRQAALEGDVGAAGLILSRLVPPLRSQTAPVEFSFDRAGSVAQMVEQVLSGVAAGAVPADTGKILISAVADLAALRTMADLETRLVTLEGKS